FEDGGEALAYFFDSGIIIRGLLAVWRSSGEERFLEIACQAGRALHRHFSADGRFHPILRLPDLTPLPYEQRWSRSPGCYQLKVALAWAELAAECGDPRFTGWYEELLADSLRCHDQFLTEIDEREKRMELMVAKLVTLGVPVTLAQVQALAGNAPLIPARHRAAV
ncbi:MAG: hypothetical protein NTY38_30195, partial [Acidobacteria bacterium]|nr:hypothetical protein [Acidobacteriota bacterium]